MESKTEIATQEVTWSQKLTDFVIVLSSGKELQVHKHVLAENSPVFEAMLTGDMLETKLNRVKIQQFSEETIINFLQYIYSHIVFDEKIIAYLKAEFGPGKHISKRTGFEQSKYTPELMGMAHYYDV